LSSEIRKIRIKRKTRKGEKILKNNLEKEKDAQLYLYSLPLPTLLARFLLLPRCFNYYLCPLSLIST